MNSYLFCARTGDVLDKMNHIGKLAKVIHGLFYFFSEKSFYKNLKWYLDLFFECGLFISMTWNENPPKESWNEIHVMPNLKYNGFVPSKHSMFLSMWKIDLFTKKKLL